MKIMAFIALLMQLESGGDDFAVGADGEIGCLQIKQCVIEDINNYYGTAYLHSEMVNRAKSVAVCRLYLMRWAKWYEHKTGKSVTPEVMVSIWQRGPMGTLNSKTVLMRGKDNEGKRIFKAD